MFIASGILGALFHRGRTGEAPVVDVSLLSTGMWAMGTSIAAAATDGAWSWPPRLANPLTGIYDTKDGQRIALCCLEPGRYWAALCETIGKPEYATDPRFREEASLLANAESAAELLRAAFAERSVEDWRARLAGFSGQWSVVQDVSQVVQDGQVRANGYLQPLETATGYRCELMTPPVQFDEQPTRPRQGPAFNEHGDAILEELGLDWDAIIDLKVRGAVA
jgi:crotonobetainyl-CoA:carnitine CoA-transferase CaiB-like acyl-CoA transferase